MYARCYVSYFRNKINVPTCSFCGWLLQRVAFMPSFNNAPLPFRTSMNVQTWMCDSPLKMHTQKSCAKHKTNVSATVNVLHSVIYYFSILGLFALLHAITKGCFLAQIRSQRDSDPVPYLYLPDEILLLIFSFLPHKDLVSCSRVSWQFYRISIDESLCKCLTPNLSHKL